MTTTQEIILCLEVVLKWTIMFGLAMASMFALFKILFMTFEKQVLSILKFFVEGV